MTGPNGSKVIITRSTQAARRRTRIQTSIPSSFENSKKSKLTNIPSMKEFLHQQSIKSQYRKFLKTLSYIEDPTWKESLTLEVQSMYQRHKAESDPMVIKMAYKDGQRQLQQLISMVGPATITKSTTLSNTNEDSKKDQNDPVSYIDPSQKDPDSWMNINDQEDPRGRVGTQWPWQK